MNIADWRFVTRRSFMTGTRTRVLNLVHAVDRNHARKLGLDVPVNEKYRPKKFDEMFLMDDGCWLWQGNIDKNGYGTFGEKNKLYMAHRYSYTRFTGQIIPPGMVVMHTCDNPPCVNPSHLRVGTIADNTADCIAKGRHVMFRKSRRPIRAENIV